MKTLFTFLIALFSYSICLANPQFKQLDKFNYTNYFNYTIVKYYDGQYFALASNDGHRILIFDSSFLLTDSITSLQLLNYLKDDLNLPDWDYIIINSFAIDSLGKLWIATDKGIVIYDIEKKEIVKSYHYKNSILPETQIFDIFIEKDTIVIYPNANEIYYFSANKFTKIMFHIDTTTDKWARFPFPNNAVFHNGKYYYLGGKSHNLIVYDGNDFKLYDSDNYTKLTDQSTMRFLKANDSSVYFFEERYNFNLVSFSEGKFTVTDFLKDGTFKIPENNAVLISDFDFDNSNNIWISFAVFDTISHTQPLYLMRYKSKDDFNVYRITDIVDNYYHAMHNISIIRETNEIFLCSTRRIFRADLNTSVDNSVDNLPNLFLLSVFPNPSKALITVNFATLPSLIDGLKLKLYNYLGMEIYIPNPEIIYNSASGYGYLESNLNGIPDGLYILVLENGDNIRSTNIIIQK